jgi:16S rRNA (uracil1498-N3)-methyltransferase
MAMVAYDFRAPRLFVEAALAQGGALTLDQAPANYLCNVLRLAEGDAVLVFNGRDGEWRASIARVAKRRVDLRIEEKTRAQEAACDLHYLFAPLKHARLDYIVQKAVELGVSRLVPVMTRHVQVARVNLDRMRANAIEAAEQCGVIVLPEIAPLVALDRALADIGSERVLVFCDEDAEMQDPVAALAARREANSRPPLAVLIGPEGGFAPEERTLLLRRPNVVRLALGPRILRADTAAVAALTLVQSVLGDWR